MKYASGFGASLVLRSVTDIQDWGGNPETSFPGITWRRIQPTKSRACPDRRPATTPGAHAQDAADSDAPATDSALLQAIVEGSTAALERFYFRYQNSVMAFAQRLLSCEEDSLEVVNDVFLAVWSSAGSFVGRSSARTWILGITHHKAMDVLRKRQRNKRLNDEYQVLSVTADIHNKSDPTVATLESTQYTQSCLQHLSLAHREVVHLAFFEDLTCNDIAQLLGCPVGTVKTRLMHARKNLQLLLSRQELNDAESRQA